MGWVWSQKSEHSEATTDLSEQEIAIGQHEGHVFGDKQRCAISYAGLDGQYAGTTGSEFHEEPNAVLDTRYSRFRPTSTR